MNSGEVDRMHSYRRRIAVAATVAAAVVLAGCAEPQPGEDTPTGAIRLYGTDGTMQNEFAAQLDDRTVLNGMKGTAPLNPLPAEFANRLLEVDSDLAGFLYAGEAYDAVVISALAAELAGTPDPEVVREYVNSVTAGGEECTTATDCLALARAGDDLAYRGASLRRGGFTDQGEPAAATYATLHFGPDGFIDDAKTEYIGAGDLAATTRAEPPEPGPRPEEPSFDTEPLVIGGLLPETGDLAIAYPPMIAGARLAIQDINDAGGVFGVDVEWIDGDDGTSADVARETLASHIEAGVHIVIGAAGSQVTEAVLPDAVAAERILFSPSNTAAELTDLDPEGFYFRTAPSDDLQGAALADMVLRDGVRRIAIVARDDAYGRGLQEHAHESLRRFGVPDADVRLLTYGVPAAEGEPVPGLDRLIEDLVEAEADGVVVVGFGEAAQIIQAMLDRGLRVQQ
jgi:ABC-type branched-subunit amino acid transport system substrate-binding protein